MEKNGDSQLTKAIKYMREKINSRNSIEAHEAALRGFLAEGDEIW